MNRTLVILALSLCSATVFAQPYVVRGEFNGWGGGGDLVLNDLGGGKWSATTTLGGGQYTEFKCTTPDWTFNAPPSNARTAANANGSITFNFFPATSWSDGWLPDNWARVGYVDPQMFGWEIMGSFNNWSAPVLALEDSGGGVYSGVLALDAGSYEFKFRKAGDWSLSIGADFGNGAPNATLDIANNGDIAYFQLDLPNGRWRAQTFPALESVVISEVYGGGGNSGATYKNDFIELHNCGSTPVLMADWSVQYASATGAYWQVTPLTSFTLQPGQFYLIQESLGSGGTQDLPTPDAIGVISMSATKGKVALVRTTAALAGECPLPNPDVVDFVGYGPTASCSETSPAPAPSNTLADVRLGCQDTDNNAVDFLTAPPDPDSSGSDAPRGACCDGNGFCYFVSDITCMTAGYAWMGGMTCDSTPDPCLASCITIFEARALFPGTFVTLCATLASQTDLVNSASTASFTLQDGSGGITVYGLVADIDPLLGCAGNTEGTEIRLTGRTASSDGLFELQGPFSNCEQIGPPDIPAPMLINGPDLADGSPTAEAFESMLVRVICARFSSQGTFTGNTNYLALDANGVQFTVRVATDQLDLVGQPIPTEYLDITGVLSQYDPNPPYDGGYQILPRSMADLLVNTGCGPATGACCLAADCLADKTAAECAGLGGIYQGDASPCTPNPCVCEGVQAARAAGPGHLAILCNVTITNDVDLVNSGLNKSLQLQDADNGAAISVFGPTAAIDQILASAGLHDRITLQGYTSEHNGLFQLVDPLTFDPNDVSAGYIPSPTIITGADFADGSPIAETLESQWVRVDCVTFADAGGTFMGVTTYGASDSLGTIPVRIATDTLDMVGQSIPSGTVNITGILSQSDPVWPFDGGYQLQLVHYAELVPNPSCGAIHPGDLNCDGSVGFGDINPFVLYLSNFAAWQTTYSGCPPQNGDINADGSYPSFDDINPFVALLSGGD